MGIELVEPEDNPQIVDGYDPKNSANRLQIDERYFLVDVAAELERRQAAAERSGVPKHALDWIECYCES